MRSFVVRTSPAPDPRTAAATTTARWTHAFQRTADPAAPWGSAAEGRLALDDFHVSRAEVAGDDGAGPACHSELVAVAAVPVRARRITVTTDVTIEALTMKLVVRAGLARARLRLALVVTGAGDDDELGAASIDLVELAAAGPDVAALPAALRTLRVPLACSFTRSPADSPDLHVVVRASWDVDCGACGQLLLRGRAHARPPSITIVKPA